MLGKLLLNYETKSLFYNQYLYKLVIKNHCSHLFRDKNLNYARINLDRMQSSLDENNVILTMYGIRERFISHDDFRSAKTMLNVFSSFDPDEYKLRIENPTMNVYTNSNSVITNLVSRLTIEEYWQPNPKNLSKLDKNVILVDTDTGFDYRVTFNHRSIDYSFYNWVLNNKGKVKIGRIALEAVEQGGACGLYFYVRDEKILQLISLLIGHNFQSVQRIVSTQDLDK